MRTIVASVTWIRADAGWSPSSTGAMGCG